MSGLSELIAAVRGGETAVVVIGDELVVHPGDGLGPPAPARGLRSPDLAAGWP